MTVPRGYRHPGEEASPLMIKTTSDRVGALEARFRDLHPYELPEFVVISLSDGSAAYLKWLEESVRS